MTDDIWLTNRVSVIADGSELCCEVGESTFCMKTSNERLRDSLIQSGVADAFFEVS